MRLLIPAAIVTLLTLVGSGVPVRAQSLAEVARKEEERRKTVKPASKVLTNKDLGDVPAPAVIPPVDTKAADTPKTGKPAEPGADASKAPVKDQAYWSGRMKDLRTQLERDEITAEAIQTQINSLSADFVNRDDPAQRAVIERNRQRALGELDRLKKAIEGAKKAIADLEEEARRASVPPGWLR
jgi:DNA repair exonuclease SbcCD ATPase subunit